MNSSLFSVLIANHNRGQYIEACLDSIMNQTYQNFEIIIVDDGSTDDSLSRIKPYLDDKRFLCFQNDKNRGVGFTKNRALQLAQGEIGAYLDPDDCLIEDALSTMVKAFDNYPDIVMAYSQYYVCNESLDILHLDKSNQQIPKNQNYLTSFRKTPYCVGHFATFQLKPIQKIGLDTNFLKAIDQDLYFKLDELGLFHFVEKPLYLYRHNPSSISLNKNGWKAKLWEMKAKKNAYKRRLKSKIQNITKKELDGEFYFTFKNLAFQALEDKNFRDYRKTIFQFQGVFRNPGKTLKFVYYTLKRNYNKVSFD